MGTCEARRGFLVLSNCDQPATTMCAQCGRPTCMLHLSPTSGFLSCLDCWGHGSTSVNDTPEESAYRYRTDYWNNHGGVDQFDDYDEASFSDDVNGDTLLDDDDDSDGAAFGDS